MATKPDKLTEWKASATVGALNAETLRTIRNCKQKRNEGMLTKSDNINDTLIQTVEV